MGINEPSFLGSGQSLQKIIPPSLRETLTPLERHPRSSQKRLACFLGLSDVGAQQFWSNASDDPIDYIPISDDKGRFYLDFDAVAFKNTLTESKGIKFLAEKDQVEMFLPNELGKEELFELDNVAVLSPDLQAEFPSIRTYVGKSRERPDVHIRLSYTPMGINAWMRYPDPT